MPMVRCAAGLHFYNDDGHASCPYCRKADVGVEGETMPWVDKTKGLDEKDGPGPEPKPTRPLGPETDGKTRRVPIQGMEEKESADPVVGWLVCVDGPAWGKDFRIRTGVNTVGRNPTGNRIQITGDDTISRTEQAVIIYDHKNSMFLIDRGKGENLNYINDKPVISSVELKRGDRIQLGNTLLLFVPLCDDSFKWGESGN